MYSDEPLANDSVELRRLEKWNMELDNYEEVGVKAEETFMLDNL